MANQVKNENQKENQIAMELEAKRKELEEREKALIEKEKQIESKEKAITETMEEITAREIKLNEKECDKESINTAEQLKKDLVEIKVPIDPFNKNEKTVDVFINGYRWTIEKGKEVKVPRAVKEILENANYI